MDSEDPKPNSSPTSAAPPPSHMDSPATPSPSQSGDPSQIQRQCPILHLPLDSLHHIFSHLPLRDLLVCSSVCRLFRLSLSSPSFPLPPLSLLALRPSSSSSASSSHSLLAFEQHHHHWLRFPLDFLPLPSPTPIASSLGLLYLWSDLPSPGSAAYKTLVVCNPLTRRSRVLPPLGSAWSRHGTVLPAPGGSVLVLSELASLYYASPLRRWLKFSSNLTSKPRSPVLVSDTLFALCDVGSPWRSHWKLFLCPLSHFSCSPSPSPSPLWDRLERHEWGDVFDMLKRPRLVGGPGGNHLLMAGGLKSSFSLNAACSTVLILRLDLNSLQWSEAARMPSAMFQCFQDSSKLKVFGCDRRVCFSAKRVGRLAVWTCAGDGEDSGEWSWVDAPPGTGDGVCRGFVFDACFDAVP